MPMTLEQARQAIVDRMMTFTGISQERIHYPNALSFTVPKEGIWCRLTIAGGPSFISGIADKPCTRRTGNILIQCFARPNTGDREITELSDALLAHFEYFSVEHLECLNGQSIYSGQDADFVQYNITIGYRVN
ncbi:phage tail terminator-like protein [Acinetobacter pittii]|uniref:phage tail terminator-like protein n=1 Tax=Acinetobacter pittii TaxID=48296 RepID=UPI002A03700F|nr:phage tail terminator-like protein [Acinetobacter pittii]MDX8223051.1 phage tail terminator-like protein [Acinetobacter pittii]WPP75283.1 phage tail terminator-like protein [Acinetobacter pittii]